MAGYIGSKAVNLSTTGADINGNANVDGTLDVTGAFTSLGIDDNATSTAITIDASGYLMAGTTTPAIYNNSAGTTADNGFSTGVVSGTTQITAASSYKASENLGYAMYLNRTGTIGGALSIGYAGATHASFDIRNAGATNYVGNITLGTLGTGLTGSTSHTIFPTVNNAAADNTVDLGVASVRFDDIYATNGTIQTSDRNEKEAIASLTPTEMLVAARLSPSFKNFKWKDSVAEKGAAARMHSGIIAQDVQDAFTAEGLDAGDYAMFISGTWWEHEGATYDTLEEAPVGATERTRLGVRYPELLAFVAAYSDQRFISIETRLAALEATP